MPSIIKLEAASAYQGTHQAAEPNHTFVKSPFNPDHVTTPQRAQLLNNREMSHTPFTPVNNWGTELAKEVLGGGRELVTEMLDGFKALPGLPQKIADTSAAIASADVHEINTALRAIKTEAVKAMYPQNSDRVTFGDVVNAAGGVVATLALTQFLERGPKVPVHLSQNLEKLANRLKQPDGSKIPKNTELSDKQLQREIGRAGAIKDPNRAKALELEARDRQVNPKNPHYDGKQYQTYLENARRQEKEVFEMFLKRAGRHDTKLNVELILARVSGDPAKIAKAEQALAQHSNQTNQLIASKNFEQAINREAKEIAALRRKLDGNPADTTVINQLKKFEKKNPFTPY